MSQEIHDAALIIVGDEILDGRRIDKHTHFLSRALKPYGLNVLRTVIVRDRREALVGAVRDAHHDCDIVFVTGGLGPTVDDITRECIAEATGINMHESAEALAILQARFKAFNRPMTDNNRRQAMVPDRGLFFENANGTAPGLAYEADAALVIALPGPPRELEPMVTRQVIPYLKERYNLRAIYHTAALHFCCLGESTIDQTVREVIGEQADLKISLLARPGLCDLALTLAGEEEAVRPRLDEYIGLVREQLKPYVYTNGDAPLEAVVGELLRERGQTVALAESCTGGLIGAMLTEVPGSSAYVKGGIISYSNEVKQSHLSVDGAIVDEGGPGAVSEECVTQMAKGVCVALDSDWSIAVTGIAGPDGGSEEKPVGTVWIAVASREGQVWPFRVKLFGNRETIRIRSAIYGIDQLRRLVLGQPPHTG